MQVDRRLGHSLCSRSYASPLNSGNAMCGVLCPVQGSPVHQKDWQTGESPVEDPDASSGRKLMAYGERLREQGLV